MNNSQELESPSASAPIQGAKYLKQLQDVLDQLPPTGRVNESPHPNRKLFFRDVAAAYLLAFFNPTLRSLRTLEDFSATSKGARCFQAPKISRSAFSELVRALPAAPLKALTDHLLQEARSRSVIPPADLPETLQHVLAVDGTFLNAAADIAWAILGASANQHTAAEATLSNEAVAAAPPFRDAEAPRRQAPRAKVRVDTHVNITTWLPEVVCVHGSEASETDNALAHIQTGAVHLYDRGIFSFPLVEAHERAGATFVLRMRIGKRCPKFAADEERPLGERDRQAGVISDRLGRLAGSVHRPAPAIRLREVIAALPDGRCVRLVTSLLDVEAWVIVRLFQYRWQVELFFRWLKTYAQWTHLMSHSRQGVEIQMYIAVVGVLLLYLSSDAKPSKYGYVLFCQVMQGQATLEEVLPILARRERACALARARAARTRADPTAPTRRYGLSSRRK
jgi:hypothetical protein